MAPTLTPLQVTYLTEVVQRLEATPHGGKAVVMSKAAAELGISDKTLQRWIKDHMGRNTGRKRRVDAGQRAITDDELRLISAALLGSYRATGNRIMTFDNAVEMLRVNGEISTDLSASRIARILMDKGLHPEQLTRPTPSIQQRSLHPNHVWQVDASVCVAYYLSNATGLQVMDEKKFYKNKPGNLTRIQQERLIRYCCADHYSHEILTRYYLGSECALHLTDFLIWCFSQKDGHPVHGVPMIVQMDMGSANTSAPTLNLLDRLQTRVIVHERHNSRANGSVEKANHLTEIHFESSLRFAHVTGLDDLNAKALKWSNWFGANKLHSRYQGTRHSAWMKIKVDELRIAPSVELMRELVTTHPKDRRVDNNLVITFSVRGFGVGTYDLRYVPGLMAGSKVPVVVNPFKAPAIDVGYPDSSTGEMCWWTVEPESIGEDGRRTDAPVIGEDLRAAPRGLLDRNRDQVMVTAFGGADADEAAARREKNALVFNGRVDPFKQVDEAQLPAFLPRRGTALDTQARQVEAARLSWVESAKRLKERLGDQYSPEVYKWLQARFPDQAVPEDQIDSIAAQFMPAQAPSEATTSAPTLRIVGGAAA